MYVAQSSFLVYQWQGRFCVSPESGLWHARRQTTASLGQVLLFRWGSECFKVKKTAWILMVTQYVYLITIMFCMNSLQRSSKDVLFLVRAKSNHKLINTWRIIWITVFSLFWGRKEYKVSWSAWRASASAVEEASRRQTVTDPCRRWHITSTRQ